MKRAPWDRLDTSAYGIVIIALISVIAVTVISILSLQSRRDSQQTTQLWISSLALDTPAVFPSGHVLRNAGVAVFSIDRRHSPHLPLVDFSLGSMMVGSRKPSRGEMPSKD
jgi:hypothetical protein